MLKRLPNVNRDPGSDETIPVLNDSVLELLQQHCGIGVEPAKLRRRMGKKLVPGKRIEDLGEKEAGPSKKKKDSKGKKKKAKVQESDEEIWVCADCNGEWEADGDDRWIVCDGCNDPYHLQCCGLDYAQEDYNNINIEILQFNCFNCMSSDESDEI